MEETQMLCTQMLVESDPEGEEEVEERQIGWLEVEGIKYRINQGENKIGRDPSCSIVIQKSSLSRTHAIIEVWYGGTIRDFYLKVGVLQEMLSLDFFDVLVINSIVSNYQ